MHPNVGDCLACTAAATQVAARVASARTPSPSRCNVATRCRANDGRYRDERASGGWIRSALRTLAQNLGGVRRDFC